MTDLFELVDLASLLQVDLDTASAVEARRKAQADLGSATLLTVWPVPVPENLRSWALELAGMVYDNPNSRASESTGGASVTYDPARRAAILAEARTEYAYAKSGPQWSFPDPEAWPDPALPPNSHRTYNR